MRDGFFPDRKLRGKMAARVDHEGAAVEQLIVLAADEIQVDHRQAGLDHARHHQVDPAVELAAVIGRSVRHQKDLGPGLGQRLADIGEPRVLADRRTDSQRADPVGARDRAGFKKPLFVKDRIIGQVMLEDAGRDAPALADEPCVEKAPVHVQPGSADSQRRSLGAVARQVFHRLHGVAREGVLLDQILRLVAGDEHLGQCDHVGAGGLRGRPGITRPRRVRRDGTHRRVELRERQAESVGHSASPCVCPLLSEPHASESGKGRRRGSAFNRLRALATACPVQ